MNFLQLHLITIDFFFGCFLLFFLALIVGVWLLYRKQEEVLENSENHSELTKIILQNYQSPQYQSQFSIKLNNRRSTMLEMRNIVFVKVEKKKLQFHTKDGVHSMDGSLNNLITTPNPLLPYPLFVQVHRAHVVNVLHIVRCPAGAVVLSDKDETRISVSELYQMKLFEALEWGRSMIVKG